MRVVRPILIAGFGAFALAACQNFPDDGGQPVWPYPDPPQSPMPDTAPPPQPRSTPPAGPQTQPLPTPGRRPPPATPVPDDSSTVAPPAVGTPAGPRTLAEASGPAALQLAQQARQEHQAGDLNAAAGAIERALRIEPQNAFLWLALAELRREQGAPNDAKAMAQRAMSRAPGNPWVAAPAWRVVQQAEQTLGNAAAARSAGIQAADAERRAEQADR